MSKRHKVCCPTPVTHMPNSQVNARIGLVTLAVLVLCVSASAQIERPRADKSDPGRLNEDDRMVRGSVRGRVLLPGGNYVSTNVKVTLQTPRETVAAIYTDGQGQFLFPDLLPGNYQIEIEPTDREHFEVSSESVLVLKGGPTVVTLTLKPHESRNVSRPASAVSTSELLRDVPAKAKKEFDKASKAAQDGKDEEAIACLRKAIALYPEFVMAHNDLGSQLLGLGRPDEAAVEFRKAITLDGKAFNPKLNLGIVLVQQHRFAEATSVLDGALALEPGSPAARLYSGLALMAVGNLETAEKNLKAAYQIGGTKYALALFHLGQLYMSKGNQELALQSFERYLNDEPNAGNADQVRKMIAMLR